MTETPLPDALGDQPLDPTDGAVMSETTSAVLGSVVFHCALLGFVLYAVHHPFGPAAGGGNDGPAGDGHSAISASFGFGAELSEADAEPAADVGMEIVPASFESPVTTSHVWETPEEPWSPIPVAPRELPAPEFTHHSARVGAAPHDAVQAGHWTGPPNPPNKTGAGTETSPESGPGSGPDLGAGRGQGGTSLFGVTDAGARYVYVIDRSISMEDFAALDAARTELAASLAHIDPAEEFQVIFFNQEPQALVPRRSGDQFFRGTEPHRQLAIAQMRLVTAEGATRPLPALLQALRLQPNVIFFLTDGDRPPLRADELRRIREMNRGRCRIHCIRFVNSEDEPGVNGNWLPQLAAENGGQYAVRDIRRGVNSN